MAVASIDGGGSRRDDDLLAERDLVRVLDGGVRREQRVELDTELVRHLGQRVALLDDVDDGRRRRHDRRRGTPRRGGMAAARARARRTAATTDPDDGREHEQDERGDREGAREEGEPRHATHRRAALDGRIGVDPLHPLPRRAGDDVSRRTHRRALARARRRRVWVGRPNDGLRRRRGLRRRGGCGCRRGRGECGGRHRVVVRCGRACRRGP